MNIAEIVKPKIDQHVPFEELITVIREYKEKGGSQQEAKEAFEKLLQDYRNSGSAEEEEVVMDVLDRVTGWCQPSDRIW